MAGAQTADDRLPVVYVSGYRPFISIFRLDPSAGRLTPVGQIPAGPNPSFLAWDPAGRWLFAIHETDPGRVRSFAIDPRTALLTPLNDRPAHGSITAHLSVDRTGTWLFVANYGDKKDGTIAVYPIGEDGRIGEAVDTHNFGPGTMAHQIRVDPSNRFVFVPCKGGPYVAQFRFDSASGRLTPNDPPRVASAPGAGPRHLDFHPNGRFVYVINELGFTMSAYRFDAGSGVLTDLQTVPTLPAGASSEGVSAADVHVHPSGRFLYGSNRGHNSIVIYEIGDDGRMTLVGHETRMIERPRNFHIDSTGALLMVANQDDASVTMFRINPERGTLDPIGTPIPAGENPSFVGVVGGK